LRNKPISADINVADLAARTEGASGSDLAAVCNRAALRALRRFVERGDLVPAADVNISVSVESEDFEWALDDVIRSSP
jgi:transitional endoplasmic reticulum ATPase